MGRSDMDGASLPAQLCPSPSSLSLPLSMAPASRPSSVRVPALSLSLSRWRQPPGAALHPGQGSLSRLMPRSTTARLGHRSRAGAEHPTRPSLPIRHPQPLSLAPHRTRLHPPIPPPLSSRRPAHPTAPVPRPPPPPLRAPHATPPTTAPPPFSPSHHPSESPAPAVVWRQEGIVLRGVREGGEGE